MSGCALALFGGTPVRSRPFPVHPIIGAGEKAAVLRVLDSGRLSTFHSNFLGGEHVQRFERQFADYHGVRHAVAVNSGTAALHVAVAAAGVERGDEVLVPSYTFTATASAVLMHQAIPVFVDVDPRTLCLDVEQAARLITPRTKAIVPVHLLGNVCAMESIVALAQAHGLAVIEDTAQAPGASRAGRFAGTWGDAGAFSFQETKNLMTGEGGMLITNRDDLAERARLVRNHGEAWVAGKPRSYVADLLGWNYRMTELEAAIGSEQLARLDEWNARRRELAQLLTERLPSAGLTPQEVDPGVTHAYHIYGLRYDEVQTGVPRRAILEALRAEGVPASPGYPHPLYRNSLFQGHERGEYRRVYHPVAERLCSSEAIWLSVVRPPATPQDMQDIIGAFEKVWGQMDQLREYARQAEMAAR